MNRTVALLCLLGLVSCSGMTCNANRHKAIRYMNMGVKKFQDGMPGPALRDLKAAVREDDTLAKAHYNLATVYQHMERWDDAQRHLNRVISIETGTAKLHYELGRCYQKLSRLDMAKGAYDKALALNPKMYKVHYRLGKVFKALDQPKQADASFRRAIEINPRFIESFISLGNLYLDWDYAELAMQVLQHGVVINDTNPSAHNALGVAHHYLKQYEKAIASFKKALDLQTGFIKAMFNLGAAHRAMGHRKEARELFDRVVKAGSGRKTVDPNLIHQANEALMELSGSESPTGAGQAAPPKRLPK